MAMEKPYTADDYFKKLEAGANGKELENLRQLADASGPTADWLIDMGADLGRVINGSQHTPKDGSALGVNLVPAMKGRVTGVRVSSPQGDYAITAKTVILATGGFASSPEMVA